MTYTNHSSTTVTWYLPILGTRRCKEQGIFGKRNYYSKFSLPSMGFNHKLNSL